MFDFTKELALKATQTSLEMLQASDKKKKYKLLISTASGTYAGTIADYEEELTLPSEGEDPSNLMARCIHSVRKTAKDSPNKEKTILLKDVSFLSGSRVVSLPTVLLFVEDIIAVSIGNL